jgi:hypothetical protein
MMVPVPLLTPRLSSLWLALVSPLYAQVGRELIDGVRNPTVVQDDSAHHDFTLRPRWIREVLARALVNEDLGFAATRWSDAPFSACAARLRWSQVRVSAGGLAGRLGIPRTGCSIPADFAHRGERRLVLSESSLAAAWASRPRDRWAGNAAGPTGSGVCGAGGRPGLLASGSGGARTATQTRGRDAGAGAGMAPVRGDAVGWGQSHTADRDLRSRRSPGPALLVWAVGDSSYRVCRNAAQHRSCPNGGREGAGRADTVTPERITAAIPLHALAPNLATPYYSVATVILTC